MRHTRGCSHIACNVLPNILRVDNMSLHKGRVDNMPPHMLRTYNMTPHMVRFDNMPLHMPRVDNMPLHLLRVVNMPPNMLRSDMQNITKSLALGYALTAEIPTLLSSTLCLWSCFFLFFFKWDKLVHMVVLKR